jgi:formyl-CoA transferase
MESLLPEYGLFDFVRQRSGASLPGIVPSNTYPCADGKYVVIGANADSIFRRMMTAIGREDMANNPAMAKNDGRVAHTEEIEDAIAAWTSAHRLDQVVETLERAEVPVGRIYDIADIVADPHYQARGMIREAPLPDGTPLKVPGIVPKLSETPGDMKWLGPVLGQHTAEVLSALGYDEAAQRALKQQGAI